MKKLITAIILSVSLISCTTESPECKLLYMGLLPKDVLIYRYAKIHGGYLYISRTDSPDELALTFNNLTSDMLNVTNDEDNKKFQERIKDLDPDAREFLTNQRVRVVVFVPEAIAEKATPGYRSPNVAFPRECVIPQPQQLIDPNSRVQ